MQHPRAHGRQRRHPRRRAAAPARLGHVRALPRRLRARARRARPGGVRAPHDVAARAAPRPRRPRPRAPRHGSRHHGASTPTPCATSPPTTSRGGSREGFEYVVVNGELVLDGGVHTGATPGRALRRSVLETSLLGERERLAHAVERAQRRQAVVVEVGGAHAALPATRELRGQVRGVESQSGRDRPHHDLQRRRPGRRARGTRRGRAPRGPGRPRRRSRRCRRAGTRDGGHVDAHPPGDLGRRPAFRPPGRVALDGARARRGTRARAPSARQRRGDLGHQRRDARPRARAR